MPPFFPACVPNANAEAVNVVRGVLADAVANVVVCACAPCVSGSLVGVAVSAVVSAISAPGCVGERETCVKHIYLVASRPDFTRMVTRTCQRKMACVARRSR